MDALIYAGLKDGNLYIRERKDFFDKFVTLEKRKRMEMTVNEEYQKFINTIRQVRDESTLSPGAHKRLESVEYSLKQLGSRPLLSANTQQFKDITQGMLKTYVRKDHDYGDSFNKSLDEFGLIASVIRIGDKMNRIKSLAQKEAKVKDESIRDTLLDVANYAIMTIIWLDNQAKTCNV